MAETKTKIPQAHGMSPEEMAELQANQNAGNVATMKKNKKSGHVINAHEKHLVHAKIQSGGFDPNTGEPSSKPFVQKFDPKEFVNMTKTQAFAGMKVEVLHNGGEDEVEDVEPTDYLKPQVVSQPGAGTPLTEATDDLGKLSVAKLTAKYKELYPESTHADIPADKKGLIAAIEERTLFISEEKAQEMRDIEASRIEGARVEGSLAPGSIPESK
jgi:hypothetical protein